MDKPLLVFAATLTLAGPALAHGGHVGELAGHSHWLGWAAVAAAAALAAWSRKRSRQRSADGAGDSAADHIKGKKADA